MTVAGIEKMYIEYVLPSLPFLAIFVSIPLLDSSPWLTFSADSTAEDGWSLFEDEWWGPWLLPDGEWRAVERALRRVLKRETKDVLFLKL